MYAGKMVTYKAIMDKQMRDWGLSIDDEAGLEWLAEFMAHTNVGCVMTPMVAYSIICDGRGDLPFDLHKLETVALVSGISTIEEAECGKGSKTPMRWATDKFHLIYHKTSSDYSIGSSVTYNVSDNSIFTSFSKGIVAIAYDAIPTDECGDIIIPAEQQWLEAASHELAWKAARKLRIKNGIDNNLYQEIKMERDWYFAQAVNHSKQWHNVDHAESVKNATVRTIPDLNAHNTFFANFQAPEQRNFRNNGNRNYSSTPRTTQSPSNLS